MSDIKFLQENIDKMSWKDLGKHLGRNSSAVARYAYYIGLKKKVKQSGNGARWNEVDDQMIVRLYKKMTAFEVAMMVDRTVESVKYRLAQLGVKKEKPSQKTN